MMSLLVHMAIRNSVLKYLVHSVYGVVIEKCAHLYCSLDRDNLMILFQCYCFLYFVNGPSGALPFLSLGLASHGLVDSKNGIELSERSPHVIPALYSFLKFQLLQMLDTSAFAHG